MPDELAGYERQYRRLTDQLSAIGFIASDSLAFRYNRCGKVGCRLL